MSCFSEYQRIPIVEHNCKEVKEKDQLMTHVPGNSVFAKARRWMLRCLILSPRHPLTRWCIKSTTAIQYEISRHLKTHPYMIHPFSSFRILWDTFMSIFMVIALMVAPVSMTFYYDFYNSWKNINDIMNVVFMLDIVIWFFTGYYDYRTKLIVLDPRIVSLKYLKMCFVFDVLTVLPIGLFEYLIPNSHWYCTTLNMMKILRIHNIIVYSRRLRDVYRINYQLHKIFETAIVTAIIGHYGVCLEYYVPLSMREFGALTNDSWTMSRFFQEKDSNMKKYLACMNRASISFISSHHYLRMKATEDIILNLILTIIGFIGYLYILTQYSYLLTTFYITVKRHLKIIQQLQEYMRYKELPHELQRRLLTFYRYRNKRRFERDQQLIKEVSPCLQQELILHQYSQFITTVKLFQHLPEQVVAQIAGTLRSYIFMTNDEIVKAGTRGDCLYFISSGTVAVYNSNGKEEGAYFGEIALVMEGEHRIATVIAVETSELQILTRSDFRRFISPYPDLLNRLQNVALEHLDRSILIDDAMFLEVSNSTQYVNISSIKGRRSQKESNFNNRVSSQG